MAVLSQVSSPPGTLAVSGEGASGSSSQTPFFTSSAVPSSRPWYAYTQKALYSRRKSPHGSACVESQSGGRNAVSTSCSATMSGFSLLIASRMAWQTAVGDDTVCALRAAHAEDGMTMWMCDAQIIQSELKQRGSTFTTLPTSSQRKHVSKSSPGLVDVCVYPCVCLCACVKVRIPIMRKLRGSTFLRSCHYCKL